MKAKEFDEIFENEDITPYLDTNKIMKIDEFEKENIVLSMPYKLLKLLEKEANKIGVRKEDLVKVWIAERLQKESCY